MDQLTLASGFGFLIFLAVANLYPGTPGRIPEERLMAILPEDSWFGGL